MGSAKNIGRVGALAVALGVGLAVATTPGIAYAQPSSDAGSTSDDSSAAATSASTTSTPGNGPASTAGSSDTESTASDPTPASSSVDGDSEGLTDEDVADVVDTEVVDTDLVDAEVVDTEVVDTEVVDTDVVDVLDGGEASPTSGGGVEDPAPVVEPAIAASVPDDVSGAGGAEHAVTESNAVDDTDQAAAPADAASAVSAGLAALSVAALVDAPTTPSSAAPTAALTPVSAVNVSSPPPTLKDLADGVVRVVAHLTVNVLDWVLAASGSSYDDTDLPWGLALLAGLRREIDQTFLAPYRISQQATAQLAIAQSPNLLVNPGAEVGDPSLSGNSSVTIPGWTVTGTPTTIKYGTLRNSWPTGLSFPMPNLPSFMGFPKASSGPSDGGVQFFGGGNVASSKLTQTVDLSAAAADIDTGTAAYNLSAWLGGYGFDLSSASVKVDFLDANKTYLGTTSIGRVGVLERFFQTKLMQRQTSGLIPTETRYAQVDVILTERHLFPLGFNVDYNSAFVDNVAFTISSNLPAPPPPAPPISTVGQLDHVFMVFMENKGYGDILGSPNAPFTNSLINAYGFADNYYGLTHPSLPNYYPVVGGTDFGKTYNCSVVCIDATTTLVSNIDNAGKTWRGYAQSMTPGQPLVSQGDYSTDQLPFPAFAGIGDDPVYAAEHLVPLEQLAIDLSSSATAPHYGWFAANEDFNGEGPVDFPFGMLRFFIGQLTPSHQYNVPALDQFLSETVPVIMNSPVWNDPAEKSVLVVTFDEDNDNLSLGFGDEGNHIVTVVIPSQGAVAGGMRGGPFIATTQYDHYSLLRMIEDSLGLPTLTNNDRFAVPMNEFWT